MSDTQPDIVISATFKGAAAVAQANATAQSVNAAMRRASPAAGGGNLAEGLKKATLSGEQLMSVTHALGGSFGKLGGLARAIPRLGGLIGLAGGPVAWGVTAAIAGVGVLTSAISKYNKKLEETREEAAAKRLERLKTRVESLGASYERLAFSIKDAAEARKGEEAVADKRTSVARETELAAIETRRQRELAGLKPGDAGGDRRVNAAYDREREAVQNRHKREDVGLDPARLKQDAAAAEEEANAAYKLYLDLTGLAAALAEKIEENDKKIAKNKKMVTVSGSHWDKKIKKENQIATDENAKLRPEYNRVIKERDAAKRISDRAGREAENLTESSKIAESGLMGLSLAEESAALAPKNALAKSFRDHERDRARKEEDRRLFRGIEKIDVPKDKIAAIDAALGKLEPTAAAIAEAFEKGAMSAEEMAEALEKKHVVDERIDRLRAMRDAAEDEAGKPSRGVRHTVEADALTRIGATVGGVNAQMISAAKEQTAWLRLIAANTAAKTAVPSAAIYW